MPGSKKHPAGSNAPHAQRLRYLRQSVHKQNQTAFAGRLGITVSRWNNFENGMPLTIPVAHELLKITPGLTLDWLYYGRLDGLPVRLARDLEMAS